MLGRAETYLVAVSIIQAFKFRKVDGWKPEPVGSYALGYRPGVNMYPKDFSTVVESRY